MGWTNSGWRSDQGGWYKNAVASGSLPIASINFRGTSGYVTDGANQTYCLAELFPTVRAGLTFGWTTTSNAADRNAGADPRFAGINYQTSGAMDPFKLTLPSAGTYKVNFAVNDPGGFSQSTGIIIKDNTTTLLTSATMATTTNIYDAAGVSHANVAAYLANSVPVSLVFASTSFSLELTGASGAGVLTNLTVTT